jgi:hypothetical protein
MMKTGIICSLPGMRMTGIIIQFWKTSTTFGRTLCNSEFQVSPLTAAVGICILRNRAASTDLISLNCHSSERDVPDPIVRP